MQKLFMSRKELATVLGISLSTVSRGWKAKIPPFNQGIKLGQRRIVFPLSCLPAIRNFKLIQSMENEGK